METANDFFRYIQEIIQQLEDDELPVQIIEESEQPLYGELNDYILNFFAECINQKPYGSSNSLLEEAIAFFESKGIRGTDIDKLVLPENQYYNWNHSILFLSLGRNNRQSEILKNFGCSLAYDQTHITSQLNRASLQLKIDHYNRIFPDKIGGKRRKYTRRKKSRRYKTNGV